MSPDSYKQTDADLIRSIVAESSPADYEGHTEFSRMSPQQRLEWLDQAVVFIETVQRGNQASAGFPMDRDLSDDRSG